MRGLTWDVMTDARGGAQRGRHPFEVFTLALATVVGLALILTPTRSSTVNQALPEWARMVWAFSLAGGSGLALVGVWWRTRVTGIVIEQVGLVAAGLSTLLYAAMILAVVGVSGAVLALVYVLGFGLSCLWRWVQLEQLLRLLRAATED